MLTSAEPGLIVAAIRLCRSKDSLWVD